MSETKSSGGMLAAGMLLALGASDAKSADIILFNDPSAPMATGSFLLHIDGPIEDGDSKRLEALVSGLPKGRDNFLLVALNSPGGNLAEGLRMAEILQTAELQVVTDVLGFDGKPADCASACSLVYVGGTYRYLQEGSRLGVHQFAFVNDDIAIKSETTRQVQNVVASITDVLSRAHVDPRFFTLMGQTAPEDMTWVDRETLREMNVLNREKAYQENDFDLRDGKLSLVMTSIGMFGVHRVSISCETDSLAFVSETGIPSTETTMQPGMTKDQIASLLDLRLLVDGYSASGVEGLTQHFDGESVVSSFGVDASIASVLLSAKSLDIRLARDDGAFLGSKFDLGDGRLSELISDCSSVQGMPAASLGGEPDTEEALSPVYVAAILQGASGSAPRKANTEPAVSAEEEAIGRYLRYLEEWSLPNDQALAAMEASYHFDIDFYGKGLTREEVMEEKRIFAERWPVRVYAAQPEGMEVSCVEAGCIVAAFVNWSAHSPERNKSASGVAWYGLGFDAATGLIVLEDGKSRKR